MARHTSLPGTVVTNGGISRSDEMGFASASTKLILIHSEGQRSIAIKDLPLSEITTNDGKTYKSISISSFSPEGINITYSSGAKLIKFSECNEYIQNLFDYDPQREKEYSSKLKAKQAEHMKTANGILFQHA